MHSYEMKKNIYIEKKKMKITVYDQFFCFSVLH